MSKTSRIIGLSFAGLALFFSSCGNSGTEKVTDNGNDTGNAKKTNDTGKVDEFKEFKYDLVISNVPIPFDILGTLNKSGAKYKSGVTNDPSNVDKYSKNDVKAVNLGIYGGDMAYLVTFEQYPEMNNYLKSAKKLADDLGIPIAFDQKTLASYTKFKDNKDSLERIIFNSYNEVDKTLKSNERIGLASLVVTGGWIEGLYSTTKTLGNTAKDDNNKTIFSKLLEQRTHLQSLVDLLSEFSKDDKFYADMITDLNALKKMFEGKTELTPQDVEAIGKKAEELRSKLVNG
ncbi:MAG TPA: hypothetical protein VI112_14455 [Bacteroidia bacterium]|jgi:hypothetical protein